MKKLNRVESIEDVRSVVAPILRKHGIGRAGVFGSFARGKVGKDSDVDLLVEIKDDLSLLDVIGIQQEIEEAVGRKVDLVEYETVKPLIKKKVLREEVSIL
jgi:predicted nucleotidyltransferase